MAKDYAQQFYGTQAWKHCRKAYASYAGGLCERCLRNGLISPGKIVHHKIHLTPENIKDPNIALDFANLELLCEECHADEHAAEIAQGRKSYLKAKTRRRYRIDDFGNVVL